MNRLRVLCKVLRASPTHIKLRYPCTLATSKYSFGVAYLKWKAKGCSTQVVIGLHQLAGRCNPIQYDFECLQVPTKSEHMQVTTMKLLTCRGVLYRRS
jgi:hypothetical protein